MVTYYCLPSSQQTLVYCTDSPIFTSWTVLLPLTAICSICILRHSSLKVWRNESHVNCFAWMTDVISHIQIRLRDWKRFNFCLQSIAWGTPSIFRCWFFVKVWFSCRFVLEFKFFIWFTQPFAGFLAFSKIRFVALIVIIIVSVPQSHSELEYVRIF